jgi:hypothetical protein
MFERALAIYRAQNEPRGQLTALYKLAGMHYERENWAVARSFVEAAWEVGRSLDVPYWQGRVLWLLGEIAFEQEDDQGAAYLAEAALCAQRAEDEQRYQLNLRSILERVAAYADAGAVSRARSVCHTAMAVWEDAAERPIDAIEMVSQIIASLDE